MGISCRSLLQIYSFLYFFSQQDYHVISLVQPTSSTSLVYDFDSKHLSFPCDFETYVDNSFKPKLDYKDKFKQFAPFQ